MNITVPRDAPGLTRALAAQAHRLAYSDIPEDVRLWCRHCVLDYLACAIAGAHEPLTEILLSELRDQGGTPSTTVIAHPVKLPSLSAALVNGAASHALDFDDVNLAMPGHPSVAILPALLGLAEEHRSSGASVVTAFLAGYELQCRIGRAIAPGHYDKVGFHATATLGSFGAAAACAHLLGLDAEKCTLALGIAGTQAAGLKSMFGTMCKPLHAGKAAYHGLLAARLAARGFTSQTEVLECVQGFASTHSPDFCPEVALQPPPHGWYIRDNLFKYHAACYLTHAPIEAARKLREQYAIEPTQIAEARLRLDASCERICNIEAPRTGLEAKFSLRLTTAMGLAGVDTGRLSSYSEETVTDPVLDDLRKRIVLDFSTGSPNTLADLQLVLTDGTILSARYDAGEPATDTRVQGKRLKEKFMALVEPVLGDSRSQALINETDRLESLPDLRNLLHLCAT